jgi:hypothetical protein
MPPQQFPRELAKLSTMMPANDSGPRFQPRTPHNLEEAGLNQGLMLDLVLRHAYFEGMVTLETLVKRTKLSPTIIHNLFRHLQKEQLCESRATANDDYEFTLSNKGRTMAEVALKKTHYVGPAPVTLTDYNRAVSEQGIEATLTAAELRSALSDLVVPERVIRELGTALTTGGALLLYGSTGNGKTSIAERLYRVFNDTVWVPHSVVVSGQILAVYDPLLHNAVSDQPLSADSRWVLCHRPMIKVGGELQADMLEPRIDETTRICVAPLQMKANNGILLIDDFGRQRMAPRELLNRWIVPLDRHTDVLSLWAAGSFEIPFEMLVVFATNLSLSDLAEEAFLRRLKNKIRIDFLSEDLFDELMRRVCEKKGLACTPEAQRQVREQCFRYAGGLRSCFPEDLTSLICGIAKFEQRAPNLGEEDINHALRMYFGA